MLIRTLVLSAFLVIFYGCNRAKDSSSSSLGENSYTLKGGRVDFDIIAKSNTLLDKEGNYKTRGHYSVIYQAKSANGALPISGLDDDSFYTMYENGKYVEESKLRVVQDSKTVSNKILLLLDFSGSIVGDCDKSDADTDPTNLCYQIVNSSKKFIDSIIAKNQTMSIYYFNSKTKPMPLSNNAEPTDDRELLKSSLDKLYDPKWREENLKGYNSTNLYGAIKVAADEVVCDWFQDCISGKSSEISNNQNRQNYDFATIVVFTDGRHTVGDNVSENELLSTLKLYKRNYYYTIGLGSEVEDDVLKRIGKNGYLKATQTQRLDTEFENLAKKLSDFANSFYRLDFCPAQQKGVLDLRIDMRDRERGFYGEIRDKFRLIDEVDFRCDL
jgi:hypothetical protein